MDRVALSPTPYWRGRVDEQLENNDREISELRVDVDELQKARWKFSGVIAVVLVGGSILGGSLATVAAYLILAALHHPA